MFWNQVEKEKEWRIEIGVGIPVWRRKNRREKKKKRKKRMDERKEK